MRMIIFVLFTTIVKKVIYIFFYSEYGRRIYLYWHSAYMVGYFICLTHIIRLFIYFKQFVFISETIWTYIRSFKIEKNLGKVCRFSDFYSVEEGFEWMSSEGDNREFLFAFGKKLREEGRYNESNAVLRQGTMCSSDPIFYVLIGNNYKDMKHYDLAEESYYKAFSVMPNRLYPLYQLMLLYQESGNVIKAKAMAKRVIEMKPKIDSQATRKMKEKAQLLL